MATKQYDDPMTQLWFEAWSKAEDDWARAVTRLEDANAALTTILIPGMTTEQMRMAARRALVGSR